MWLLLVALIAQTADYQADGIKALDAKQYDTAVDLFTKAVAADSHDYAARFHLALSYSLLGKNADAIREYEAALQLKPELYEAEINLGMCLLRVHDAGSAVPHLKIAAAQKPKAFQPAFYLARALLDQKHWAEAETAYSAALELDPGSAAAEAGLAQALAHEGRRGEAEPHFRKAASLDPTYKNSLLELASLYEENHQASEAIAIYREFPDDTGAVEHMGALLLNTGHADQAVPALEAVVAKSPTAANRVALAQAYLDTKQPDKASPLMAQAVASEPGDYELRMFYGRALRDQHKYAEAASQFLAAAQIKPDSVQSWNELGTAFILAEQYPQSIAAFDRVFALGGETTGNYYFRALAFDHLHQRKEAVADYNKFLELSQGKHPDEEFKARQRVKILEKALGKR